jgi:hypothetical protein
MGYALILRQINDGGNKMKYYIGHLRGGKLQAFQSNKLPTHESHGKLYYAVTGPFKTKRAALWAEKYGYNNPHFQTIDDAERLSK